MIYEIEIYILPWNYSQSRLYDESLFGNIVNKIRKAKNNNGTVKGCCHVTIKFILYHIAGYLCV